MKCIVLNLHTTGALYGRRFLILLSNAVLNMVMNKLEIHEKQYHLLLFTVMTFTVGISQYLYLKSTNSIPGDLICFHQMNYILSSYASTSLERRLSAKATTYRSQVFIDI